jgi:hypothetical protein
VNRPAGISETAHRGVMSGACAPGRSRGHAQSAFRRALRTLGGPRSRLLEPRRSRRQPRSRDSGMTCGGRPAAGPAAMPALRPGSGADPRSGAERAQDPSYSRSSTGASGNSRYSASRYLRHPAEIAARAEPRPPDRSAPAANPKAADDASTDRVRLRHDARMPCRSRRTSAISWSRLMCWRSSSRPVMRLV